MKMRFIRTMVVLGLACGLCACATTGKQAEQPAPPVVHNDGYAQYKAERERMASNEAAYDAMAAQKSAVQDVLIEGYDDGVQTSRGQDRTEAIMDAKLQAIERAGVEISSITRTENFVLKQDLIESRAKAVLMPGFQIIDKGYQLDGSYLVILSGQVRRQ